MFLSGKHPVELWDGFYGIRLLRHCQAFQVANSAYSAPWCRSGRQATCIPQPCYILLLSVPPNCPASGYISQNEFLHVSATNGIPLTLSLPPEIIDIHGSAKKGAGDGFTVGQPQVTQDRDFIEKALRISPKAHVHLPTRE